MEEAAQVLKLGREVISPVSLQGTMLEIDESDCDKQIQVRFIT